MGKKIRKGPSKDDSGERRSVIRSPGQVSFSGFAVWQSAKGAYVMNTSDTTDGKLMFGKPKRPACIARYADLASACECALNVGPYGLVIYAEPDGTVFIVG